jgi:hypothetical protein
MFKRYLYRREYRRKQKADKQRLKRYHKDMRQQMKADQREERKIRFRKFISDPFARKITPEQEFKKGMKLVARQQQKEQRRKWLLRFRHNPIRTLFFREKTEEEILIAQLRKEEKRASFSVRAMMSYSSLKEILKTPDLRNKFALSLVQSTTYYILSFLFIYIVYQLITIAVSRMFDIPTIWYYYRVKFPLFSGSHLYTRAALIAIFACGPLLSLILSFIFLNFFLNKKVKNHNLKLFFLWGFINGASMFFGSYIVGFITRTEFIYVSEWIFLSSMFDVEEIIFTLISITISLLIGRLATPLFIISSGSVNILEPKVRIYFILSQAVLPWMIGVVVFYLLTSPHHYLPFFLKTLSPILIIIPSLFSYNSPRNVQVRTAGIVRRDYFKWSILIAMIALLFFYRIMLNFGLKFFSN